MTATAGQGRRGGAVEALEDPAREQDRPRSRNDDREEEVAEGEADCCALVLHEMALFQRVCVVGAVAVA
jgi:hypothetical protein